MIKTANYYKKAETPYTNLSAAIIERALLDYKTACTSGNKNAIRELRRFFLSEWFRILSDMDGAILLERIERTVHT